jgi:hypothetical protein
MATTRWSGLQWSVIVTRRWSVLATALFALPASAHAQTTRGVVRDSMARAPLAGVVVTATDSAGGATTRTITDSAGRFALDAPRAVRLKFVRIGYVPQERTIEGVVGAAAVVSMSRIPPLLTTVRVAERAVCGNEQAAATAEAWRAWDQARAGLLAASAASTSNPVTATSLLYSRRLTTYDHLVRRQSVEQRSALVGRPFTTAAPERLVERGYLDEDATGRTFHGPDATVLLDESFATTHCFDLRAADANHRGAIGIGFTPIPTRDTIVDVAGVIWLSENGSALHSLEFNYTALEPAALKANAGGRISFRTLPNGVIFVDQWSLRLPVMTAVAGLSRVTPMRGQSRRMANVHARVTELEESGAVVTHGAWRDGTTWTQPHSGITGVVRESGADSPVAAAIVSVEGSGASVLSDRSGEFMLAPLIPGRYTVSVVDTSLTRHASPRRTTSVVEIEPDQLVRISPRVESLVDVVADVCKGQREARIVVGQVTSTPPLSNARIRASWTSAVGDSASAESRVDDRGRFLLCGPTVDAQVALRLEAGRVGSDTVVDVGYTRVTSVAWNATLRDIRPIADARVVRGIVSDSGRRPIARVSVSVAGSATAFTDDTGAFRLRLPSHEAATLELRRLGFAPARFALDHGGDTTISATLLISVQQLEAMSVRASPAASAKLRGFNERLERRARGITFGTFITAQEIERRSPARVTNMFDDVPWAFVRQVNPGSNAIFARAPTFKGSCAASVFIDGVPALGVGRLKDGEPTSGNPVAIDDLVSPQAVAGIEAYRSGFDAPAQLQPLNGTCAVILIWTK